ncbi:MAG: Stp1/IreP family PP2C-type Ser/Thr phosphatase [Oscillospiraceae bacterium]|nr:Stp1/IreP family PP2C-type Ser/Thr phosphatase [Oscillospiraceae bacterium]
MEILSKTDRGLVRSDNQDYCLSGKISDNCAWAVVCDGMGGANGGHTASTTASEYIAREIQNLYTNDFTKEELVALMINIVVGANLEVYNIARKNVELMGMGTTCELVFVRDSVAHIVHVGDSRTYLFRNNKMIQLTEDHSLVQEMVKRGEITQEEARNHPNKNFITRAVGVRNFIETDYIEQELQPNDAILICTDGLTNCVTDEEMTEIVKNNRGDIRVKKLVDKAKDGGGTDNITVIVIQ